MQTPDSSRQYFAIHTATNRYRHARELPLGSSCACECPRCHELLEVAADPHGSLNAPSFLHGDADVHDECRFWSWAVAVREALADIGAVSLQPQTPVPMGLFDEGPARHKATRIGAFTLTDYNAATLGTCDGQVFIVRLLHAGMPKTDDADIDLILDLTRNAVLRCTDLGNLRTYLSLDERAWQWNLSKPARRRPAARGGAARSAAVQLSAPSPAPPPGAATLSNMDRGGTEWTETARFKGFVVHFHRRRWPSGVVTERSERVEIRD